MRTTGTWLGEYTYGAIYDAAAGKSVPFTMSLTESWLGNVVGYVRDDASKGGMPERGRIAGTRKAAAISFVKTMPIHYVSDDSGNPIQTKEWLRREHGIENANVPPHQIHYAGDLDADGLTMHGRWIIRGRMGTPTGETIDVNVGEGTWTARRISDLPSEV